MKRKIFLVLVVAMLVLSACARSYKATVKSVEIVDSINVSGVYYRYDGQEIIKIVMDFSFDKALTSGLDKEDEDKYLSAVFKKLDKGTHFYFNNEEVERTYGFWPEKVGSTSAKDMALFYVVPKDRSGDSMRFVYDGEVLGEGGQGIDQTIDL